MKILRRYKFYKRLLLCLLAGNVLIFSISVYETITLHNIRSEVRNEIEAIPQLRGVLEKNDRGAKIAFVVSLCTFLFGVIVPAIALYKVNLTLIEMRQKTEKQFVTWLNWWVKNYANIKYDPQAPFYSRPDFWLNVGLLALETYGPDSKNPIINYFGELAPLVRNEITKDKAS